MSDQTPVHCCIGMDKAINEKYLVTPIETYEYDQDGKHGIGMRVSKTPCLVGPTLTPRGRKRAPMFQINLCPWCGHDYRVNEDGTITVTA